MSSSSACPCLHSTAWADSQHTLSCGVAALPHAAGLAAYLALLAFKPDLVIASGTAGGFRSEGCAMGDLYLASKFIFHDRRDPSSQAGRRVASSQPRVEPASQGLAGSLQSLMHMAFGSHCLAALPLAEGSGGQGGELFSLWECSAAPCPQLQRALGLKARLLSCAAL